MIASLVRRYIAHSDGKVAIANLVSVVIAWNTPFYPLYVWWEAGAGGMPWLLLCLCSLPFFATVPAVSQWSSLGARVMLPLVGIANTVFCTWLLGEAAGAQLFLLPCCMLGALLFRPKERVAMLILAMLPLIAFICFQNRYPVAPYVYQAAQYHALLSLNAISVGCLTIFLGVLFATRNGSVA